jgi:hypothetical protein
MKTTKKKSGSKAKATKGTVRRSRSLAVATPSEGASGLAEEHLSEGARRDLAAARAQAAAPDAALDADVAAAKKARAGKKADKTKGERKPSLLTLAADVLREAGTPMDCKTMVEKVLAKGTWKTSGRTPQATLYSAVLRETQTKGDKARFRKVSRGQFELTEAGKNAL